MEFKKDFFKGAEKMMKRVKKDNIPTSYGRVSVRISSYDWGYGVIVELNGSALMIVDQYNNNSRYWSPMPPVEELIFYLVKVQSFGKFFKKTVQSYEKEMQKPYAKFHEKRPWMPIVELHTLPHIDRMIDMEKYMEKYNRAWRLRNS